MAKIVAIALTLTSMILLNIVGQCEMSVYPGLRRKPSQQSLQFEEPSDFLAQLMGENARRRLQQQFLQQLELINMQIDLKNRQRQLQKQLQQQQRQRAQELQELVDNEADNINDNMDDGMEDNDYVSGNGNGNGNGNSNSNNNYLNNNVNQFGSNNGDFSYNYPSVQFDRAILEEPIQFAVGPTDPRYYEETVESAPTGEEEAEDLDPQTLSEYEEYVPAETKDVVVQKVPPQVLDISSKDSKGAVLSPAPAETSKLLDSSLTTTFHRIKPQTAAAAAVAAGNVAAAAAAGQNGAASRHDITALIDKLQKEGKSGAIINTHGSPLGQDAHVVVRQHLAGIDNDMSIYVVALIAGVSAALTVGVIGLGIAWLHNKNKSAADVDYPAYGVTGPNKDISPSGDRKLAQSAQMYHYQHQKQQIIAMENRQAVEGSCGLSDVESDEEEEGDYTVYECPGLAPTGEMEVKNPLFLDETPVTPAGVGAGASAGAGAAAVATPTNNITQAQPAQPQSMMKKHGKPTHIITVTSSDEKPNKKSKK